MLRTAKIGQTVNLHCATCALSLLDACLMFPSCLFHRVNGVLVNDR